MRVVLDISQAAYPETGVGVYTIELARELKKLYPTDIRFFFSSLRGTPPTGLTPLDRFPFPPSTLDLFWNRLHVLSPDYFLNTFDMWHASDWTQPPTARKSVTTVHDLAPFIYPHEHHPRIVDVHTRKMKWVTKETDCIIAVSTSTKHDLIRLFGIDEKRITVIPEAPRRAFKPVAANNIERMKKKYGIDRDYFLAVGTIQPRKNYGRLLSAFTSLRRTKTHLLIIGRFGWGSELDFPVNVHHIDAVSDLDFPAMYAGARALVYPSLYEGFGLPILEALSVGTIVIASKTSSLPEVGGDTPMYIDPNDTAALADAMRKAEEMNKDTRHDLIRRGRMHARKFSWRKTAEETHHVYMT